MATDILMVCRNQTQMRVARAVFGRDFSYRIIGSALTGHRFRKIVVLGGDPWSEAELREIREHLPTRLMQRGELYVL